MESSLFKAKRLVWTLLLLFVFLFSLFCFFRQRMSCLLKSPSIWPQRFYIWEYHFQFFKWSLCLNSLTARPYLLKPTQLGLGVVFFFSFSFFSKCRCFSTQFLKPFFFFFFIIFCPTSVSLGQTAGKKLLKSFKVLFFC